VIKHIEYFRRRIEQWKEDLLNESNETIANLRSEARDISDEAERASRETENTFELRTRDRYRKLLKKVNKALDRIQSLRLWLLWRNLLKKLVYRAWLPDP